MNSKITIIAILLFFTVAGCGERVTFPSQAIKGAWMLTESRGLAVPQEARLLYSFGASGIVTVIHQGSSYDAEYWIENDTIGILTGRYIESYPLLFVGRDSMKWVGCCGFRRE